MNKYKHALYFFALMFFNNCQANIITLLCSGQVSAKNSFNQHRSGDIKTTVEFNEQNNYFNITDTGNLERGAIKPYKEMNFFDDSIHWKTSTDAIFGNGTFYGHINRKTGEMKTNYFIVEITGGMVIISGSLFCTKQTENKF
ncbi:MAG: hypothetical protein QUV35_08040 [Hydrogenophaga sp.]|uniref:hypothetical protein n=1 Tax=Hydrogenophaga sp. TaxID=1904254 RepID=UPI00261270B3|nr:hypothetical protein [Hydrogenophaga sp.]MDM7942564.1 hypothetical protein [Hydrogenophaga sp.]